MNSCGSKLYLFDFKTIKKYYELSLWNLTFNLQILEKTFCQFSPCLRTILT
jgi:hypothetical protein